MKTLHNGDLDSLFIKHDTDKSSYSHNYAYAYELYIDPSIVKHFLEIGVASGASLRAWKDWCPEAEIHGIDRAECNPVEGCILHLGNVTDSNLTESLGTFDVIVDDGSHDKDEIHQAINLLWPHLKMGGWYVVEDLAPSAYYGGVPLFLKQDAWEVHRHGEIIFARKGGNAYPWPRQMEWRP